MKIGYKYNAKVIRVVDGDTIDVMIDLGLKTFKQERLRLNRINTPEIHGVKKDSQEYIQGMTAKNFVVTAILGADVIIETLKDKKGKYGRYLAEVHYEDSEGQEKNLNDALLQEGLAKFY